MDDRIRNESDPKYRSQSSGRYDSKRTSRAGDFKVSINYDSADNIGRSSASRNASYSNNQGASNKFRVSIPEQNDQLSKRTTQSTSKTASPQSQQQRKTAPSRSASQASSASKKTASSQASAARRSASQASSNARRTTASKPTKSELKKAEKAQKKRSKQAKKSEKKVVRKLTAEQTAKQREVRRYRRTKSLLILIASLVFIAIITTTLSTLALSTINDILAINKSGGTTVSVYVPEDASFDDVFNSLADSGLINQKFFCKLFCKFRHYDMSYNSETEKYDTPVEYEAGVYYFEIGDGLETMLESMKVATSSSKETVRLTFPEGWTIAQIFAKIEKYNVCTAEKLYANLDIIGNQFDFYENIDSNSGRYLKAEGYLFPDTYDFYIGESASSVLKKLFSNYESKWTSEYTQKAKELGYTQDQIMIIASIIQREAKDSSQMADISSVIHNRLANSATYPLLNMNSTQDYITATKEYGVFTDFYYTLYLNSYNTYSEQGLPPGAICNPGIDAIEAALNPSDTNYFFFCHDDSGNIYLASTAAEHQANTEKILYEAD